MAIYHIGATGFFAGTVADWDLWTGGVDGDFRAMLVLNTFTQNQAHDFRNDVVASEATATGYTARGETLAVATRTIASATSPSDLTKFDAANVVYANIGNASNNTLNGAIIYRDTGTDTTSGLIAFVPFPSDVTTSGGTLTIILSADGIFYMDATP